MTAFKRTILLVFYFVPFIINAQEGTRSGDYVVSGKVMIIPFEPLMYMSEIDKKINEHTDWNFKQIREKFRRELDVQLLLKLKTKTHVISFYIDSMKMAKDLDYIYKSRILSYEQVDKEKPTSKSQPQKAITNGQLTVEVNNDKKFMNIKIINPTLLPYLNKKYGSTYFIFLNELDIKNDLNAYDIATDSYQREVTVHYTIIDKTAKVIAAGVAVSRFSGIENDPKKIIEKSFLPIDEYIAGQFTSVFKSKETPAVK